MGKREGPSSTVREFTLLSVCVLSKSIWQFKSAVVECSLDIPKPSPRHSYTWRSSSSSLPLVLKEVHWLLFRDSYLQDGVTNRGVG